MSSRSRPLLGAGAAILAVAAGIGLYLLLAHEPAEAPTVRRPDFQLAGLDGEMHSIAEWDGKILVVNFWATWCPPCRREIPLLIELQKEYGDQGVQIIGIAIDDATAVREYAESIGINYVVLVGEQDALQAADGFGVDVVGLPVTAFSDAQGVVRKLHTGELHRAEAEPILRGLLATSAGTAPDQ